MFAVPTLAGRFFSEDEERANGPGAAIISERFWARRFQRDRDAVGRGLIIGGRPYAIVGIMPRIVHERSHGRLVASTVRAGIDADPRGAISWWSRPDASGHHVRGGGAAIWQPCSPRLAREFPKSDAGWSAEIASLKESRIGDSRRGLVLIFAAVASLWLIAVANIAGLTLVQVQRRSREMAIRAALGASRARVIGTVIREGLLVALAGGLLARRAGRLAGLADARAPATHSANQRACDRLARARVRHRHQPDRCRRVQLSAGRRGHARGRSAG